MAQESDPVSVNEGYNELLIKWITEWKDAAQKSRSKLGFVYFKALKSVREHKEPIRSGMECKKLKGFGDKICARIEKKLKETLGDAYTGPPEDLKQSPVKRGRQRVIVDRDEEEEEDGSARQQTLTNMLAVRKRFNNPEAGSPRSPSVASPLRKVARNNAQNRTYIPAQGSSGFAILVALLRYELEHNQKLVNKLDLQEMAQRYTTSLIGQANAGQRYSGWNVMKTLLAKELVDKTDARNSYFFLTDQGRKLAINLAKISPALRDFADQYLQNVPLDFPDSDNDTESTLGHCDVESVGECSDLPSAYQPFIFEPGQYEIILCIDNRERIATNFCSDKNAAFAAALQKQDVRVEIRQLPLGDFVWIAREKPKSDASDLAKFASVTSDMASVQGSAAAANGPSVVRKELVLDFIIERKRIDDLAGSIKDRRWDEQKSRLRSCGLRRPIYLVEYMGKQSRKMEHGSMKPDTLDQAITNCQVDGFDVKQTDNFEETVRYLAFMTRWLERKYANQTLMSAPNKEILAKTSPSDYRYITFNEFATNSNKLNTYTVKEMWAKHLVQIKGLSLSKIQIIVDRYPTLIKLLAAYDRKCDLKSKHSLLADLKTDSTKSGTNRRLGPAISRKMYDFYNSLE